MSVITTRVHFVAPGTVAVGEEFMVMVAVTALKGSARFVGIELPFKWNAQAMALMRAEPLTKHLDAKFYPDTWPGGDGFNRTHSDGTAYYVMFGVPGDDYVCHEDSEGFIGLAFKALRPGLAELQAIAGEYAKPAVYSAEIGGQVISEPPAPITIEITGEVVDSEAVLVAELSAALFKYRHTGWIPHGIPEVGALQARAAKWLDS